MRRDAPHKLACRSSLGRDGYGTEKKAFDFERSHPTIVHTLNNSHLQICMCCAAVSIIKQRQCGRPSNSLCAKHRSLDISGKREIKNTLKEENHAADRSLMCFAGLLEGNAVATGTSMTKMQQNNLLNCVYALEPMSGLSVARC